MISVVPCHGAQWIFEEHSASVDVCPKWFGNSKLEQSDDATCLRGANRKSGVYFDKAQTVNACVRADGCTEKTREYEVTGAQKLMMCTS